MLTIFLLWDSKCKGFVCFFRCGLAKIFHFRIWLKTQNIDLWCEWVVKYYSSNPSNFSIAYVRSLINFHGKYFGTLYTLPLYKLLQKMVKNCALGMHGSLVDPLNSNFLLTLFAISIIINWVILINLTYMQWTRNKNYPIERQVEWLYAGCILLWRTAL